jgi:hypothetical protein
MIKIEGRSRRADVAIDEALRDRHLLGAALGDPASWATWLAALRASSGLPLIDEQQQKVFASIAGDRPPPAHRVRELWAVVGRGGGKSRVAAAVATHTALLQQTKLAPGEVGHVLVLSPTIAQAKIVFGYVLGFIEASPVLRGEIVSTTASEIRLRNNIIIGTHPNSFRSVRGRTLLAVIFDEVSFWRDTESANPDLEVHRAVLPSLIRSNGQLIAISTPYRKLGLLYQKHRDFFGVADDDVLVVQGDSRAFNPTLSGKAIVQAMADDPEAGISEWQGLFRADISAFLSDADIDAVVDYDRPLELPPRSDVTYQSFLDPSGGRHDAFAICIAHKENERTVVDVIRSVTPPFDPADVVAKFAALLKEYRCYTVRGDNYSAEWTVQAFKAVGIRYERSELAKSQLYTEGLVAFTRRAISLPNHQRLLRELRLLERHTHTGGRDSVDHGRTGSDDLANSLFGCLRQVQKPKPRIRSFVASGADGFGKLTEIDPETRRPIGERRGHLVSDGAGNVSLAGGDNTCWTTEELRSRRHGVFFIRTSQL